MNIERCQVVGRKRTLRNATVICVSRRARRVCFTRNINKQRLCTISRCQAIRQTFCRTSRCTPTRANSTCPVVVSIHCKIVVCHCNIVCFFNGCACNQSYGNFSLTSTSSIVPALCNTTPASQNSRTTNKQTIRTSRRICATTASFSIGFIEHVEYTITPPTSWTEKSDSVLYCLLSYKSKTNG